MPRLIARIAAVVLIASLAGAASAPAQAPVDLTFYYPVAVGGPVTKIIDGVEAPQGAAPQPDDITLVTGAISET